jgi:hypothetical protein
MNVSTQRFDLPEVFVKIKCEVHPWEFAFVAVLDHPFFAVTDTNGCFRLPEGLTPGRYTIEAAHPKAGRVSREIVVEPGVPCVADFTFAVPPP